MATFKIEPHFWLQEWVAEEKGYFRDEGLDYEFKEFIRSTGGAHHVTTGQSGAFQSIGDGSRSLGGMVLYNANMFGWFFHWPMVSYTTLCNGY